ncbi:PDZ and LIM domain protein 2 [Silurus asotus]|uniref:PDZ and LIM domain protein 2 n=1 Tax=Silurus asotus TaxID=30991 RepID=A0AAD5FNA9_SILAS|nr:PDZ and LIM domain protein 2 [Silurus asotus]
MAFTVTLTGPSPWGFRISGGRDFKKAITVSKVNPGSKAEKASLQPGDVIMEINGENTGDMLNVEAQNKIKSSKTQLQLLVERPPPSSPGQTNGISSTEQLVGRFQETLQVRDENQNYREYSVSSPTSFSSGPYSPESPSSPDRKWGRITPTTKSPVFQSWTPDEKITSHRLSRPLSQEFSPVDSRCNSVSSRTPTPPDRYSPHSPIDREIPTSPRRNRCVCVCLCVCVRERERSCHWHLFSSTCPGFAVYLSSDFAMQRFDRESEVYKMIQENKESRSAPRQSNTFKMLQEVLEADEQEAALMFPGKLSPNPPKPVSSVAGVQKYHTCEKCGNNIVTQAVKILDERFRHPECYTCTECGLNLKMRGHFWVGDELYCEKHARQRYQGPGAGYRHPISPQH